MDKPEDLYLTVNQLLSRCWFDRKCDGVNSKGKKCQYRAKYFYPKGGYCSHHTPKNAERNSMLEGIDHETYEVLYRYHTSVKGRITSFYSELDEYRRVPPPETLCATLLYAIQNESCFMCWALGRGQRKGEYLVEDHCHKTGMVRSLLCRSCNVTEGKAYDLPWQIYREYAPANGWYYRYFGFGEQWHSWDPDPLVHRVTEQELGIEDKVKKFDFDGALEVYLDKVSDIPETTKTKLCKRSFDALGRPELLPGERYLDRSEMKNLQDWPIAMSYETANK